MLSPPASISHDFFAFCSNIASFICLPCREGTWEREQGLILHSPAGSILSQKCPYRGHLGKLLPYCCDPISTQQQPLKARRSCLGSRFTGFQLAVAKRVWQLGWLTVVGGACSLVCSGGIKRQRVQSRTRVRYHPQGSLQ